MQEGRECVRTGLVSPKNSIMSIKNFDEFRHVAERFKFCILSEGRRESNGLGFNSLREPTHLYKKPSPVCMYFIVLFSKTGWILYCSVFVCILMVCFLHGNPSIKTWCSGKIFLFSPSQHYQYCMTFLCSPLWLLGFSQQSFLLAAAQLRLHLLEMQTQTCFLMTI